MRRSRQAFRPKILNRASQQASGSDDVNNEKKPTIVVTDSNIVTDNTVDAKLSVPLARRSRLNVQPNLNKLRDSEDKNVADVFEEHQQPDLTKPTCNTSDEVVGGGSERNLKPETPKSGSITVNNGSLSVQFPSPTPCSSKAVQEDNSTAVSEVEIVAPTDSLGDTGKSLKGRKTASQKHVSVKKRKRLPRSEDACFTHWMSRKKGFKNTEIVDRGAMLMKDLIYFNPKSNDTSPEESESVNERISEPSVEPKLKFDESTKVEPKIDKDSEESEGEEEEEEEEPVPQVKIGPDGSIILDDQSVMVERQDLKKVETVVENVEEFELGENVSYNSFRSRSTKRCVWTERDTRKFYLALQTVGTDFMLIQKLFPGRTRWDIRNKFRTEERNNRHLVDKAMTSKIPFDNTLFDPTDEDTSEEEEAVPKKRVRSNKPQGKSAKHNDKIKEKKSIKDESRADSRGSPLSPQTTVLSPQTPVLSPIGLPRTPNILSPHSPIVIGSPAAPYRNELVSSNNSVDKKPSLGSQVLSAVSNTLSSAVHAVKQGSSRLKPSDLLKHLTSRTNTKVDSTADSADRALKDTIQNVKSPLSHILDAKSPETPNRIKNSDQKVHSPRSSVLSLNKSALVERLAQCIRSPPLPKSADRIPIAESQVKSPVSALASTLPHLQFSRTDAYKSPPYSKTVAESSSDYTLSMPTQISCTANVPSKNPLSPKPSSRNNQADQMQQAFASTNVASPQSISSPLSPSFNPMSPTNCPALGRVVYSNQPRPNLETRPSPSSSVQYVSMVEGKPIVSSYPPSSVNSADDASTDRKPDISSLSTKSRDSSQKIQGGIEKSANKIDLSSNGNVPKRLPKFTKRLRSDLSLEVESSRKDVKSSQENASKMLISDPSVLSRKTVPAPTFSPVSTVNRESVRPIAPTSDAQTVRSDAPLANSRGVSGVSPIVPSVSTRAVGPTVPTIDPQSFTPGQFIFVTDDVEGDGPQRVQVYMVSDTTSPKNS